MEPCRIAPLAIEALIMLSIGICPGFYAKLAGSALECLPYASSATLGHTAELSLVGFAGLIFLLLAGFIYTAKSRHINKRSASVGPTWGCGYTEGTPKIQYTATSFVKTYVQLFSFVLGNKKEQKLPVDIFPTEGHFESESYDKLESNLIDKPLTAYHKFMDRFSFLQNGKMQFYVLYGIIFIICTLAITFIFS